MKVLLIRDVKGLGRANDIKDVAEGYARNYLLPRGLAAPATDGIVRAAEQRTLDEKGRATREKTRAERLAAQIQELSLRFVVKAGETGRLYGSITSKDIADAIAKHLGFEFDKRQIMLEHPIRDLGVHLVEFKLASNVHGQVRLVVEAEE